MRILASGFLGDPRVAWGCAALFAIIAICSFFRRPLGLEALMIKLDTRALGLQSVTIQSQGRLIATQSRLITTLRATIDEFDDRAIAADSALERLKNILRMEGSLPWDEGDQS